MVTLKAIKIKAAAAAVFAGMFAGGVQVSDAQDDQDIGGKDGKAWVWDNTDGKLDPTMTEPLVRKKAADVERVYIRPYDPEKPEDGGEVIALLDNPTDNRDNGVRSVDVSKRGEDPRYELRLGPRRDDPVVALVYVNQGSVKPGDHIGSDKINDLRGQGYVYKDIVTPQQEQAARQAREDIAENIDEVRAEATRRQQEALAAKEAQRIAASGQTPEQLQYRAAFSALGVIGSAGGDKEKIDQAIGRAPAYESLLKEYAERLENGENASALRREYQTKVTQHSRGVDVAPAGVAAQPQREERVQVAQAPRQPAPRAPDGGGISQSQMDMFGPDSRVGMRAAAVMAVDEVRNMFRGGEMSKAQLDQLIEDYEDAGHPEVAQVLQEAYDDFSRNGVTNDNIDTYTRRMGEVVNSAAARQAQNDSSDPFAASRERVKAETEALNERRREAALENAQDAINRAQARAGAIDQADSYLGKENGQIQVFKFEGDNTHYVLWKGPENGPVNVLYSNQDFLNGAGYPSVADMQQATGNSVMDMAVSAQAVAVASNALLDAARNPDRVIELPRDPARIQDPALREAVEQHLREQGPGPQGSNYDPGLNPAKLG